MVLHGGGKRIIALRLTVLSLGGIKENIMREAMAHRPSQVRSIQATLPRAVLINEF